MKQIYLKTRNYYLNNERKLVFLKIFIYDITCKTNFKNNVQNLSDKSRCELQSLLLE